MLRQLFCLPCCERSNLAQIITGDDSAAYEEKSVVKSADYPNKSAESSINIHEEKTDSKDSTGKPFNPIKSDLAVEVASTDTNAIFVPIEGWKVRVRDIWGLGITIVIGGQYFSWNAGLSAGFGSYAIATGLIATAYICLCCSVSELASTMPFAGGGYGLARVTLGFYTGFLIGCCEIIEYIVYVAISTLSLGTMFGTITGMDPKFEPLVWVAFYVSSVSVYCYGGKLFWLVNFFLAFSSIAILVMYCLGSLKFADFRNAQFVAWDSLTTTLPVEILSSSNGKAWFVGGFSTFMYVLPLPAWFYVGIESINFACTDIQEPNKNIPKSSLACIATLVVTSIAVLFISSSLPLTADATDPQSSLARSSAPLNIGFRLMFNISDAAATALSIPATYATAFGFIFSYGRLMIAMSESRLLPRCFRKMHSLAYISGSLVSFGVCLLVYFVPVVSNYLFNITILSGFCAYTSQLYGFIMLRTRFKSLPRKFHSPLGIPGAVLGIVIFLMGIVAVVGFQRDNCTALITLVIIGAVSSLYYVQVAKDRQKFSKDELKVTFAAHVMKMEHLTNAARKMQTTGRMNLNVAGPRRKKKKKKVGADGAPLPPFGRRMSSMSLRNALDDAVMFMSPVLRRSNDIEEENDGDREHSSDEEEGDGDGDGDANEMENGNGHNLAGGGIAPVSGTEKDGAKKSLVPMLSLAGGGGVLDPPPPLVLENSSSDVKDMRPIPTQSPAHRRSPEVPRQDVNKAPPSSFWVAPDDRRAMDDRAVEVVVAVEGKEKEICQEVPVIGQDAGPVPEKDKWMI